MTIDLPTLQKRLKTAHCQTKSWRAVGRQFDVTGGLAFRIAEQGYEPKSALIRQRLGLSALLPAPSCPKCGQVHLAKRCQAATRGLRLVIARSLNDWPRPLLRWALVNREVMK